MSRAPGSFKDFVLDQLDGLLGVTCRAMFGGFGLYRGDVFFGIIHKGRLYFKTNETNREHYRACGMKPFRPNRKQTLKTYYEVPVDVMEDTEQLACWAERAMQCAPTVKGAASKDRAARKPQGRMSNTR